MRAGGPKQKTTSYAGGSQRLIEGYLKGKNAMMIFDRYANLKYKYGSRHFWSRGYDVSTVGVNEATFRKNVREQEKHYQMMDKISTKEVEDPFRGS